MLNLSYECVANFSVREGLRRAKKWIRLEIVLIGAGRRSAKHMRIGHHGRKCLIVRLTRVCLSLRIGWRLLIRIIFIVRRRIHFCAIYLIRLLSFLKIWKQKQNLFSKVEALKIKQKKWSFFIFAYKSLKKFRPFMLRYYLYINMILQFHFFLKHKSFDYYFMKQKYQFFYVHNDKEIF